MGAQAFAPEIRIMYIMSNVLDYLPLLSILAILLVAAFPRHTPPKK